MESRSHHSFQDSAVGMPPKRQTRYTKTSKRAVLSPSPPPCELLTTSAPTQVPLPLPLKTPTPTPSDMDVGWLVGCDEYVLDDSTQYLLVRSPFSRLKPPADDTSVHTAPCATSPATQYHWPRFPLPSSTSSAFSTSCKPVDSLSASCRPHIYGDATRPQAYSTS